VRKITNQIREINYEFKQAEDVKKRDAQLEFERAQVELQQQHEKHERDEQIAQAFRSKTSISKTIRRIAN
jgi:CRISPR/Cas system CMR-associated protein Cmr1 (group 7 of RAMP superfamily)